MRSPLVAMILAAVASMTANFNSPSFFAPRGTYGKRSRTPGKPGKTGSKTVKLVDHNRIGVRHP